MFRVIFLFIACWLLYKLVFELIIPVYKASKTMRSQFRQMKEQMNGHTTGDNGFNKSQVKKERSKPGSEDYIEFEEVKE